MSRVLCNECRRLRNLRHTVWHPDGYRLCYNCFWDEIDKRLNAVFAEDHRFNFLKNKRSLIGMFIATELGRERALLWEPKEILKEYARIAHHEIIGSNPENKRAKIGKVIWVG